jgi:hypothetical protein
MSSAAIRSWTFGPSMPEGGGDRFRSRFSHQAARANHLAARCAVDFLDPILDPNSLKLTGIARNAIAPKAACNLINLHSLAQRGASGIRLRDLQNRGHRQVRQRHRGGVMLSKLLTGWVAHHVTGGIGRYELPTYLVQWGPVIVSNRYDIALRMPHTRYFFMDDDGLAITDQRTQPRQSVTIDCPSRAFRQMSCQWYAPARYIGGYALPLLLRCEDQTGKTGARHTLRNRCIQLFWRRRGRPFVGRPAGHKSHVVARFGRERAVVR